MRTLRTLLAATLLATAPNALMAGIAQAQTCACPIAADEADAPRGVSRVRIVADEAPPPLPEYDQPPLPAPGYMWTPGYWAWNNDDYYWVPGTWVQPPRVGLLWTPGYWGFVEGAYLFHRGYWGPHIGFYGGVSYGFGYFGAGFEGGRWDGDRFFYNRTVNNFGTVNIVNVYERPAPQIVQRVSFNGGPEGVKARPTPEEIAAAKETHVAPTAEQRRNVSAASRNESAFVSNNAGKPPVAATAKPGEFKGAAVAPARAAGGLIKPRPTEEPANTESAKPTARTETPEPKTERLAPKAETPEPKAEKPAPKAEKPEKAEALSPKAEKPEPKTEKTDPKPDAKAERPKTELERPKSDAKPEPKAEKPKSELERPKPDAKAEKPKAEMERPEPKAEKPKAEMERPKPEPKAEKPKAEVERPAARPEHPKAEPQRAAAERPAPACHPGAPNCPK